MLDRIRWTRQIPITAVGVLIGNLAGGLPLALSTGLGFLVGGIAYDIWFLPWMEARLARRFDERQD